jgi:hypothetical protein
VKEPKELEINGKTYFLSKFPAVAGRRIITQYPITGAPIIGNYEANEDLMCRVMKFVGVKLDGRQDPLMLTSQILIDNHVDSWETLVKIEKEMMVYNCSFFQDGRASTFFDSIAQNILRWIIKILTHALAQSSIMEKQPSTS